VGGYVPAAVPGGLAELACHPGTSQSLDSRNKRNVWLVSSVIAHVLAYQETAGPLALRFAPFRSPGSRMPRRERAVEMAGAGSAQRTVSGGPMLPGVHGPASACEMKDNKCDGVRYSWQRSFRHLSSSA